VLKRHRYKLLRHGNSARSKEVKNVPLRKVEHARELPHAVRVPEGAEHADARERDAGVRDLECVFGEGAGDEEEGEEVRLELDVVEVTALDATVVVQVCVTDLETLDVGIGGVHEGRFDASFVAPHYHGHGAAYRLTEIHEQGGANYITVIGRHNDVDGGPVDWSHVLVKKKLSTRGLARYAQRIYIVVVQSAMLYG